MSEKLDGKTLADVQPGGRVRLGDQAERARFEAWAKDRGHDLSVTHGHPIFIDGVYEDSDTYAAWLVWQAALSAQPSPGGQGDALVTDAMVYAAEEAYANSKPDNLHESFRVAIAAALAARQPVGEPVKGAVLIDGTVHLVQKGEEMDWVRDRGATLLYVIDRSVRNG